MGAPFASTKLAANGANAAEADAADAFAEWAVDNAQLAMLDAVDARTYANQLAKAASAQARPD